MIICGNRHKILFLSRKVDLTRLFNKKYQILETDGSFSEKTDSKYKERAENSYKLNP